MQKQKNNNNNSNNNNKKKKKKKKREIKLFQLFHLIFKDHKLVKRPFLLTR